MQNLEVLRVRYDAPNALQAWEGVRYKFSACTSNELENGLAENRTRPRPPVGIPTTDSLKY